MDAMEYLKQVKRYDVLIYDKLAELDKLKALAYDLSANDTSGDRVSGGGSAGDTILTRIASIQEREEELDRLVDYYVDMRAAVLAKVEGIKDPVIASVLYRRYFQYQTWERIAVDLNYTYQWVNELHKRGLETLDRSLGSTCAIFYDGRKEESECC